MRIAQRRCLNHEYREAAGRCPRCGNFFCRECVTEHDGKLICTSCLSRVPRQTASGRARLWPRLAPAGGFLLAWAVFAALGWLLASLPGNTFD